MLALLTNQLFLVFVVFSVSCHLCHFLSPVVLVVSLYLILFSLLATCIYKYIYSPSVSLVLCELLNVMVVCGWWLTVCSSLSMKSLHIPACFPQLLYHITLFYWDVSLTSASLSLYLV